MNETQKDEDYSERQLSSDAQVGVTPEELPDVSEQLQPHPATKSRRTRSSPLNRGLTCPFFMTRNISFDESNAKQEKEENLPVSCQL